MAQTAGVDDPLTCSRCQAMVTHDELGLGLAVRVNGELICPACIEQLPSEAQLSINRVRAMKGLGATTYSVGHPRHRERTLFTFSTSGLLNHHRRSIAGHLDFPTPPLPPSMSSKDAARPAAAAGGVGKAAMVGGIAAGVVLVAGIGAWLALRDHGGKPIASTDTVATVPGSTPTDVAPPTPPGRAQRAPIDRNALPADAIAAWKQAANDNAIPVSVRDQVADELRRLRTAQLDEADTAIGDRRFADALSQLQAMDLPEHPSFQGLIDRGRILRMKRFAAMRDPDASVPPPLATTVPTAPASTPVTATVNVPPDPKPQPAVEARLAPGSEQETIDVTSQHVVSGNAYWKSQWRVVMGMVAGGRYDVWIRATAAPEAKAGSRSDLDIDLASFKAKVPLSGASTAWQRVFTDITLKPGEHAVVAKSAISHWRLRQVHLTGAGSPEPPPAPPELVPEPANVPPEPQTGQQQPPLATRPAEAHSVAPPAAWDAKLLFPANQDGGLPLDGSARIPSPWPSPQARFYASERDPKLGKSTLVFDLPFQMAGGAIFLMVHPGLPIRRKIAALVEVDGKKVVETIVEFSGETWTPVVLDLSAVKVWTGRGALRLIDTERYNDPRGMIVGPLQYAPGRAPLAGETPHLRPVLLMADLYDRKQPKAAAVIRMLNDLARLRRQAGLDLKAPRILVTNLDNDWRSQVRKALQEWTGSEALDRQVDELGVGKDWWTQQQYQGPNPLVDAERHEAVVIVPNGAENQYPPDKLAEWARVLAGQISRGDGRQGRGGMLPVFVIGSCEKGKQNDEGLDERWAKAIPDLALMGVPVIDIRPGTRELKADDYRLQTARRLVGGLRNLAQQIQQVRR